MNYVDHQLVSALYAMHDLLYYADSTFKFSIGMDDKVRLGASTVHGRGVFAKRDILKGEVVTLYPAHLIVHEHAPGLGVCYTQRTPNPIYARMHGASTEFTAQVCKSMTPTIVDGTEKYRSQFKYNLSDNVRMIGDPSAPLCNNFLGHMVNDAVSLCATSTIDDIVRFVIGTTVSNNAFFVRLGGYAVACVALKTISQDCEVFASYGVQHWMKIVSPLTLDVYLADKLKGERLQKIYTVCEMSLVKGNQEALQIVTSSMHVRKLTALYAKCQELSNFVTKNTTTNS